MTRTKVVPVSTVTHSDCFLTSATSWAEALAEKMKFPAVGTRSSSWFF